MDFERARADILHWAETFVEAPHPKLNNWAPCPFARRARLANKFDIRQGKVTPYTDCSTVDMQNFDVIAFVYNPVHISADQFNSSVECLNSEYLIKRNMIALADHPADVETVNGVIMNQGTWALCFLQDLSKLNAHAHMLAAKGYYKDWPEEYLQLLFTDREDPRT